MTVEGRVSSILASQLAEMALHSARVQADLEYTRQQLNAALEAQKPPQSEALPADDM